MAFNAGLFRGSAWPRPNQVPNLVFWLDADDDSMFTSDPISGQISALTTKDANAFPFVPVDAVTSHQLVRSRKKHWNNRKVISTLAQGGCGLVSSANIDVAGLFAPNGTDHTFFFVGRSDDTLGAANGTVFFHYVTGAVGHYLEANASGSFKYLNLSTTSIVQPISVANGLENIFCFRRNANTLQMYLNGAQISSASNTATPIVSTPTTMKLFCPTTSGAGYHGDVAEMLMYSRALTENERIEVENHLARKWLGLD
jgi:Concanavalin A-like lectin/glucanases superfamily